MNINSNYKIFDLGGSFLKIYCSKTKLINKMTKIFDILKMNLNNKKSKFLFFEFKHL